MYFLKILFIYLMSILLIISLYKDLTKGISFSNNTKPKQMQQIYPKEQKGKLQAVAVRVQAGDTLLSVTEQFNQQTPELDIDQDRKSTRLNSSHVAISYAVFCLKKKTTMIQTTQDKKQYNLR